MTYPFIVFKYFLIADLSNLFFFPAVCIGSLYHATFRESSTLNHCKILFSEILLKILSFPSLPHQIKNHPVGVALVGKWYEPRGIEYIMVCISSSRNAAECRWHSDLDGFDSPLWLHQIKNHPVGWFFIWWSRGESNPCPKATWKESLRAQFVIYIPSSRREQTPYGNQ